MYGMRVNTHWLVYVIEKNNVVLYELAGHYHRTTIVRADEYVCVCVCIHDIAKVSIEIYAFDETSK